jgi:Flp pilus assembly protein TadD
VAYGLKGDFAAAVEECTVALRYDPEHARAYELRGRAYGQPGDLARAQSDQDQAAQLRSGRVGQIAR